MTTNSNVTSRMVSTVSRGSAQRSRNRSRFTGFTAGPSHTARSPRQKIAASFPVNSLHANRLAVWNERAFPLRAESRIRPANAGGERDGKKGKDDQEHEHECSAQDISAPESVPKPMPFHCGQLAYFASAIRVYPFVVQGMLKNPRNRTRPPRTGSPASS